MVERRSKTQSRPLEQILNIDPLSYIQMAFFGGVMAYRGMEFLIKTGMLKRIVIEMLPLIENSESVKTVSNTIGPYLNWFLSR